MLDVEMQMARAKQTRLGESVNTSWLPEIHTLSLSLPGPLPQPLFVQKQVNGTSSKLTQEMTRDCSKQGGISVLEDSLELDSQQKQCCERDEALEGKRA